MKRLKAMWERIKQRLPVSRRTAESMVQAERSDWVDTVSGLRKKHAGELEDTKKRVDDTIRRLSDIQFERMEPQHGRYQVSVTFDSRMFSAGPMYDGEQRFIAERVARDIEHEIASSKFVKSAYELEMERMDFRHRNMPKFA